MTKTTSINKMNLYFTYKSQDTLKSFTLLITIKTITKLNLGHSNKFEIELKKLGVVQMQFTFIRQCGISHVMLFCKGRQRNAH